MEGLEKEAIEAATQMMNMVYDIVLKGDFLTKAAKTVKKYVEELEKQGFSHDEAINIASRFNVKS